MAKIPPPKNPAKGKGAPPPIVRTVGNLDKPEPKALSPLNFKVPPDFKRDMKVFAAEQGLSLVDVLKEGFTLVKAQRGAN